MTSHRATIHPDAPATSKCMAPTSDGIARHSGPRRYFVVLNERAGSIANAVATTDDLLLRFKAAGLEVATAPDDPLAAQVAAAIDSGADVIVAAGGDGTITAVASALVGTDKALAILPLGTVNLLARDLGIPLDVNAAIAALAAMQPRRIRCGRGERCRVPAQNCIRLRAGACSCSRAAARPWISQHAGVPGPFGPARPAGATDHSRDRNRRQELADDACVCRRSVE